MRVSEFTPWGLFVKAWGWGVLDGAVELQTCPNPNYPHGAPPVNACQKGLSGSGPGQFNLPWSITIDASGDLYVVEEANLRVQKFDAEGNFEWMVGGEVNKTTKANLCTKADVEGGDECGAGVAGTECGQFSTTFDDTSIAVGPGGTIFVGDKERIQKFNANGQCLDTLAVAGTVRGLDVDNAGNFYLIFQGKNDVHKLDASGTPDASTTFPVISPSGVTVDSSGNVYAVEDPFGAGSPELEFRVVAFTSTGTKLVPTKQEEENKEYFAMNTGLSLNGLATSDACGVDNLYVTAFSEKLSKSYLSAYGPQPDEELCPLPTPPAPTIEAQYPASVGTTEAVLRAEINPHFAPDTTFYVEYGTESCKEGGCATQPAPPGAPLNASDDLAVTTAGIPLGGLTPGTTYNFRFVAISGEFTTKGLGEEEAEGTFTTYRSGPR
ncbi:MAG TPA: hypothetical protein VM656_00370, partial [Pyrinomonadaceae bacterium]|nr:hypothetical protein [Pyrinomonadaceae bacterium]